MKRLTLLLVAVACGDSSGPPAALQPASFAIVGGAAQVDTVARELGEMIALRALAADGVTPVPSYPISWTVLDGGSVFATVVNSGTDGIARQRWTLGTGAGAQRLVARALEPETGAVLVDDTLTATALPAAAFRMFLGVWDGPSTTVATGDSVRLRVDYRDQFNNSGAPCADRGAWDRITWWSEDSTVAYPTGTVGIEGGRYYGWIRAIATGSTMVDGRAECIPYTDRTTVTVTP